MRWSRAPFVPLTPHGITLAARTSKATLAMRRSLDPLIAHRAAIPVTT